MAPPSVAVVSPVNESIVSLDSTLDLKSLNSPLEQITVIKSMLSGNGNGYSSLAPSNASSASVSSTGSSTRRLPPDTLKVLKKLASARIPNPEAMFILAGVHSKGLLGMPVDHAKAFDLYFKASKLNHPTATYRAAVCYELGVGTKKDLYRACQFFRKAASLGDGLAMHKLAVILLYGKLGQRQNLKEGITWLKRAADNADEAHPESLHELAQCYEKNGGCPVLIPDEFYAFELYSTAADWGFAASQYRLGSCYEYGLLGCQVNPELAIRWYSRAAEQGFPDAELALSSWYLSGAHGCLPQSDTDAYLWARKAAERGHTKAEYQIGTYYENGIGVSPDEEEALRWYKKAADKGHRRAELRIAEIKKARRGNASRCTII